MLSRLLLMRHAKSSWSDGSLSDHERPLNDRGRRAATAVGATLTARGLAPDIIWSSDAKRTRETRDWLDPAAWKFTDLILPRDLEA